MSTPYFTFDVTRFRITYPQFTDPVKYPDAVLQNDFDMAGCYIANQNYGFLQGDCRFLALNLMTAHLALLATQAANGQVPKVMTGATIDKVAITLQGPPVPNQFRWWLNTTPYGAQLLALLLSKGVGGLTVGGLPELTGFRKIGGTFAP